MKQSGRTLGIDYGSKRIGLAVSDPMGVIAQGAGTVANDGSTFEHLVTLIEAQEIRNIVVGMPYGPDGGRGAKAMEVELFIGELRRHTAVPIATWDESFTSVDARRAYLQGGMKRKQRQQKGRVDEMAARIMLQEYLDSGSPGTQSR